MASLVMLREVDYALLCRQPDTAPTTAAATVPPPEKCPRGEPHQVPDAGSLEDSTFPCFPAGESQCRDGMDALIPLQFG